MTEASGLFKRTAYKKEAVFGVKEANTGGQLMRRNTVDLSLNKDTYGSNEVASHQQRKDFRHGVRRGTGKVNGDLSAQTWSDFFATFCKRLFTAAPSATGLSITIAGAGPTYTITRAAGDWLAGGFKRGMVGTLSGAGFVAGNIGKNVLIVGVTATVLTVIVVSQNVSGLTAEGPIAASGFACTGKVTWIPTTGHIEESYDIEQWYPEVPTSEVFVGSKINGLNVNLPATGIATIEFDILAKNVEVQPTQYFAAAAAETETDSMAAVNGVLRAAGGNYAVLTGLTINGMSNYTGDPVVGSNSIPKFFPGRIEVSGQATAYFESAAMRDAFLDETELEIIGLFTGSNAANAQFLSFVMPRVKLGGHNKSDGTGAIIATIPFTALLNYAGGAGIATEKTTLLIQDSNAA